MQRRAVLVVVGLVVAGAGMLTVRLAAPSAHPIVITHAQIGSIAAAPWPEGPGMPTFARHASDREEPLSVVLGRVPSPLPSPSTHGARGGGGGVLTVTLRDGRVITYGPYDRPPLIDRLWGAMVEATQLTQLEHRSPGSLPTLFHQVSLAWIQHGHRRLDVYARRPRAGERPLRLIAYLLVDGVGENPHPAAQPATCHSGDTLVVRYRTGQRVTYGPCVVQPFIEMLWGGMRQAAAQRRPA
jgi:hypothetical protein